MRHSGFNPRSLDSDRVLASGAMRSARLVAACVLVMSCGSAEPGTGTGKGGAGGGDAGAAGTAGTSGGTGGSTGGRGGGSAGTGGASASAGAGGSGGTPTAGSGGNAGTGGGAGAAGNAGRGGNGGTGGSAAGRGGTGGTAGSGGAGGTGGASGGRGGATGGTGGATGGRGGSGGAAGSAGTLGQDGGAGRGGSGGAAGADAGIDGGGGFNPCPATGNCLIMPLGDSITFGVGSSGSGGGYRVPLFQTTITNMDTITFVGRQTNGPTTVAGRPFPRSHEGYSGYTIDPGGGRSGISPLVDDAISMAHPHIVLLMIGTNDVNIQLDLANAPTRLGNLLDRIITDAPNALLVVARITPTQTAATNTRAQTYNNAIPGLVQTRVAAGKHIVMVDMYAAFTANANYMTALMSDDLHPNDAGYMVMAQTWYAAIRNYLPGN